MSLKHQQQPTHNSCMSACVAMISSQPVTEVVTLWHEKFHNKEAWLDDAMDYYRGTHQILVAVKEGPVVEILDPAKGRDGAKYYVYGECHSPEERELISWSVDLAIPVVEWGDHAH